MNLSRDLGGPGAKASVGSPRPEGGDEMHVFETRTRKVLKDVDSYPHCQQNTTDPSCRVERGGHGLYGGDVHFMGNSTGYEDRPCSH